MEKTQEGTLYRTLNIEGVILDIFYGYYSEHERELWDPTPIFPDLKTERFFTEVGHRLVRADQDVCTEYSPKPKVSGENWCNDCKHYSHGEEIIGICRCKKNKIRLNE